MNADEDLGLVLLISERGDSFLTLAVLSVSRGLYHPLLRKSKRSTRPDLFDTARAHLSRAKQGDLLFLSDYQITRRRSAIARSYEVLQIASRFAEIVRRNTRHLPDYEEIFQIAEQFFDSLEKGPAPRAAYLKSLYRFAKTEGLPVREDWAAGLGPDLRDELIATLKRPLSEQSSESQLLKPLSASLEEWLAGKAHFIIPR